MTTVEPVLRELQRRLTTFYGLEQGPDITAFVRHAGPGTREALLVRQTGEDLELQLLLPEMPAEEQLSLDLGLQLIEGVSHFLYVAERARTELPATQLELELQAEVDKFVVLALDKQGRPQEDALQRHAQLFDDVKFVHSALSETGQRYRVANALAGRFVRRLADAKGPLLPLLRRFYRCGQTEKIQWMTAA